MPLETVPLETERLILRDLRADDAAALFAHRADAEAARYWSTPPWTDMAQAEAHLRDARKPATQSGWLQFGVERRADGALLGTCSLFDHHVDSRRAEIGYFLGRPYWGQGFAREAAMALIGHGFGTLNLNRIEADVDPRNVASVRLLERLGFVREGLLRQRWIIGGEVSDSALYGLLAAEWARG